MCSSGKLLQIVRTVLWIEHSADIAYSSQALSDWQQSLWRGCFWTRVTLWGHDTTLLPAFALQWMQYGLHLKHTLYACEQQLLMNSWEFMIDSQPSLLRWRAQKSKSWILFITGWGIKLPLTDVTFDELQGPLPEQITSKLSSTINSKIILCSVLESQLWQQTPTRVFGIRQNVSHTTRRNKQHCIVSSWGSYFVRPTCSTTTGK